MEVFVEAGLDAMDLPGHLPGGQLDRPLKVEFEHAGGRSADTALRGARRPARPHVPSPAGRSARAPGAERVGQEHGGEILTGLLPPTSGTVRLDGADVLSKLESYKAHLGYVPEEPYLYSYLTAPEDLQLVGRLRGVPPEALREKIDRFLQALGIFDDRYQTLSSYSKGMRQKVLIAAAVLHNPRVVVLDEPFSGLERTPGAC